MSNFVVCFNAVLPLIIYVAVGMTVRKAGLINGAEIKHFNRMLFAAFFPVLMFDNIYDADIKSAFDPRLMLFAAAFIIVSAFVSCLAVTKITKDLHKRGAMAQAIYRSKYPELHGLYAKILQTEAVRACGGTYRKKAKGKEKTYVVEYDDTKTVVKSVLNIVGWIFAITLAIMTIVFFFMD